MSAQTDTAREAHRQGDGTFGPQQRSEPDVTDLHQSDPVDLPILETVDGVLNSKEYTSVEGQAAYDGLAGGVAQGLALLAAPDHPERRDNIEAGVRSVLDGDLGPYEAKAAILARLHDDGTDDAFTQPARRVAFDRIVAEAIAAEQIKESPAAYAGTEKTKWGFRRIGLLQVAAIAHAPSATRGHLDRLEDDLNEAVRSGQTVPHAIRETLPKAAS